MRVEGIVKQELERRYMREIKKIERGVMMRCNKLARKMGIDVRVSEARVRLDITIFNK